MKPATTAAKTTIQREHAVYAKPRLTAEWEYNRFFEPTVTVVPEQTLDEDWQSVFGDTDSVALPNRPRTGIAKARLGGKVKPLAGYRDTPSASRFYPPGVDDPYTYFSSQEKSATVAVNGEYKFSTPIDIKVVYPETVIANKIVVGFETSYAKPKSVTVQYTADGNNWYDAQANALLDTDGTVTIYRTKDEWDTVRTLDFPFVMKGVRVLVHSMTAPGAHVDVLQVGARLENDLSDYLIDYDIQMEVSDRSFIAPMGKASSNTATATLSNIDGRFNNHNANSAYFGLIDQKIRFTLDLGIDATPHGGQKYEYVRMFTGWSTGWGSEGQSTVQVSLKDSSVFLQEAKMPVVFYEDATTGAIVWQVMDRLGYSNYAYTRSAQDNGMVVPFYWPKDTDTTVWDEFATIAQSTQTAIYFDEYDVLQIRPRRAMYGEKDVDWNFDAITNGTKLPDIIDMQVGYELETNHVDVKWRPAHYTDYNNGIPQLATSWEPEEETVVLRASTLVKDLLTTGKDIWVRQSEANFWPYKGLVNIRGEILSYEGKEYAYYSASGVLTKKVIKSLDEQKPLDDLNEFLSYKNSYTGRFVVKERGLYGSGLDNHKITQSTYTSSLVNMNNTGTVPYNLGKQQMDGYLKMWNHQTDPAIWHLMKHESVVAPPSSDKVVWYGARIRFPKQPGEASRYANWSKGGLFFAGSSTDDGFYLEFTTTAQIDGWENRVWQHEVSLLTMRQGLAYKKLQSASNADVKGVPAAILNDKWYDVEVKYQKLANNYVQIAVFLDGVPAGNWYVAPADQGPNEWRFGAQLRGTTRMDVEYLFAFVKDDNNPGHDPDDTAFLDLKTGGYASGYITKEYKYNFRTINPYWAKKRNSKVYRFPQRINNANMVFDEFGPVVHEIREFDVQFKEDSRPVGHSQIRVTNSAQVEVVYYESDAFGARFMLANASRQNAVVKGEDNSLGADTTLTHSLFIYGRSVYQDDERTITKKDDASVRRRGTIRTEITGDLIQTEAMAESLGEWITELWVGGVDEVTMRTYGNPFIQLGDLVTINFPIKDMLPSTHKYFVVSLANKFTGGFTTEVVLRRARV